MRTAVNSSRPINVASRSQPVNSLQSDQSCSRHQPSTSGRSLPRSDLEASESRRIVLYSSLAILGTLAGCPAAKSASGPDVPLKEHISKTLRAPANFLRARLRADGGSKILAPIRASKRRLLAVEKTLHSVNVYDPNPQTYKKMLQTVRSASMNCYAFEAIDGDNLDVRASLLQNQIGFADACTYRLIAKNVTLLLTQSQQQLKLDTLKQLNELINSFQLLDDMVDRARDGDPMAVERLPDVLQFTLAHTNAFEGLIEQCLGLPVSNRAPRAI